MAVRCPHCGAENPEGVQYCNLCCASFGFDNLEYTSSQKPDEGFRQQYPSSFNEGAPAPPPGENVPAAGPVDIGRYGVRSGERPFYEAVPGGAPSEEVDIGRYGAQSGLPPSEIPGEQWLAGHPGTYGSTVPVPLRRFNWGRAIRKCLLLAIVAAFASMVLELVLGFVAINAAFGGNFTLAYAWIMVALLIPCCASSFLAGYQVQGYGWAVGAITVALWGFVFRPLYAAILNWLISESFNMAAPFNKFILIFNFAVFLPLGFFLGWLGEKRATTGLWF